MSLVMMARAAEGAERNVINAAAALGSHADVVTAAKNNVTSRISAGMGPSSSIPHMGFNSHIC